MKLMRLAATGAAFALIGGSVLFAGTAATAADPTTNYVSASQFVDEDSPYPAGWFIGDGSTGELSSTDAGLAITGKTQILNGSADGADLNALVSGAQFNVASGEAFFQVSLFAGPGDTQFTTLRPETANVLTGTWTLSRTVNDGALVAGQPYTLAEIVEGIGPDYTILAYGAFVDPDTTATIASITWNGVTSVFTPEPVTPVVPVKPAVPAVPVQKAASFTG